MISDSLRRAGIALRHWPLSFAAFLASGLLSLTYSQRWMNIDDGWTVLLAVAAAFALLTIYFWQARLAGEPSPQESGSWLAWLGWDLLSLLPMLPLLVGYAYFVGFDAWAQREGTSLGESVIFLLCAVVAIPMLVVSAGRAIHHSGVAGTAIMRAVLQRTGTILPAAILLVLAPSLLIELLDHYTQNQYLTYAMDLGVVLASAILLFTSALLTAGIYASIYRSVEQELAINTAAA